MKICFEGFEHPIPAKAGRITTIEIENRTLYARICQSLQTNGVDCQEPFTLWDNNIRLRPEKVLMHIANHLTYLITNGQFSRHFMVQLHLYYSMTMKHGRRWNHVQRHSAKTLKM